MVFGCIIVRKVSLRDSPKGLLQKGVYTKRLVVFLVLAALLAVEIYYQQPMWWRYFLGPILGAAWKAILVLPVEAKALFAVTAALIAFAVWFVKKWGLHILVATAVLAMIPGISLWIALQLTLGTAILAICLQAWHHFRRKAVTQQRVEPRITAAASGSGGRQHLRSVSGGK
jgi:hypothetical protein